MLNLIVATWLLFTLPDTGQRHYIVPDSSGDSVHVECSGGPPIRQLLTARLYGSPVSGGGFRLVSEHSVQGMEGRPDSFPVPWPGSFYVTATNPRGESCASNLATVAPDDLTAVGTPDETLGRVTSCAMFDVQGRRVASLPGSAWSVRRLTSSDLRRWGVSGRLSSGIYWLRGVTEAGVPLKRRVVIVR